MKKLALMPWSQGQQAPENKHSTLKSILKAIALTGAGAALGGGIGWAKGLGKLEKMIAESRGLPGLINEDAALLNIMKNTAGGAAIGGATGLGTSVLTDTINKNSAYVQGLIDKCASKGINPEALVVKFAQGAPTGVPVVSKEERKADAAWRVKAEAEQKKNPPKEEILPPVKSSEYRQGYMQKMAQLQQVKKIQMTKEFIKKMLSGATEKPIIPIAGASQQGTLRPLRERVQRAAPQEIQSWLGTLDDRKLNDFARLHMKMT